MSKIYVGNLSHKIQVPRLVILLIVDIWSITHFFSFCPVSWLFKVISHQHNKWPIHSLEVNMDLIYTRWPNMRFNNIPLIITHLCSVITTDSWMRYQNIHNQLFKVPLIILPKWLLKIKNVNKMKNIWSKTSFGFYLIITIAVQ